MAEAEAAGAGELPGQCVQGCGSGGSAALVHAGPRAPGSCPAGRAATRTVAPCSCDRATAAVSPAAVTAAVAAATWRSLISDSRCPPGASHAGAAAATRRSTRQAVRAAVQGHPRLVVAGFRRQQPDLAGRHVGHVGQQDVHPAAQPGGQRPEQVALVDLPARGGQVAPGAAHRGRVDVGGVHLGPGPRAAASAAPRAPEPQHRSTTTAPGRASAMAWLTRNSVRRRGTNTAGSTAIRRPQNSAQPSTCSSGWPAARRSTRAASSAARPGGRDQQIRLVLGVDAARRAEPGGHGGAGSEGCAVGRHECRPPYRSRPLGA